MVCDTINTRLLCFVAHAALALPIILFFPLSKPAHTLLEHTYMHQLERALASGASAFTMVALAAARGVSMCKIRG